MEHTGYVGKLPNHRHAVLMGIPLMNNNGQLQLPGQLHLHPEGLLLNVPGNVLIVIVQTNLTDGLDLRILFA